MRLLNVTKAVSDKNSLYFIFLVCLSTSSLTSPIGENISIIDNTGCFVKKNNPHNGNT